MALAEIVIGAVVTLGGAAFTWHRVKLRAPAEQARAGAALQETVNEAVKVALAELKSKVEDLRAELKATKAELDTTRAELKRAREELEGWERAAKSVEESLRLKREEEALLKHALLRLEAERNESSTGLIQARAELRATQEELEKTRAELADALRELAQMSQ